MQGRPLAVPRKIISRSDRYAIKDELAEAEIIDGCCFYRCQCFRRIWRLLYRAGREALRAQPMCTLVPGHCCTLSQHMWGLACSISLCFATNAVAVDWNESSYVALRSEAAAGGGGSGTDSSAASVPAWRLAYSCNVEQPACTTQLPSSARGQVTPVQSCANKKFVEQLAAELGKAASCHPPHPHPS